MLTNFVFLVALQTAFGTLIIEKPIYDVDDYNLMGLHFEKYIKTYSKQYSSEEKPLKFKAFVENVRDINRWNTEHSGATFDINQFTDMTEEEQLALLGFRSVNGDSDSYGNCTLGHAVEGSDVPASWDWRDHGAVSPVKDQQTCGSCWAFSTTGLVESRYLQKKKTLILSEQQLVDCDTVSAGCDGGLMTLALTEIMKEGGQEPSADYPYEDKQGKCRFDKSKVAAKVTSCSAYALDGAEDKLQNLLYTQGPIAIAVQAKQSWIAYKGGIYKDCDYRKLNHGVLLVGYGTENGEDFWVIKNSWGAAWGEKGFIRMNRGVRCCGIANKEAIATVTAVVE